MPSASPSSSGHGGAEAGHGQGVLVARDGDGCLNSAQPAFKTTDEIFIMNNLE
jgi:hypothetical protein